MNSLLLVMFFSLSLSSASFAADVPGKIVGQMGLVEGEVLVDSKPVQKNAQIREGAVVEVKKGHATVILGKGSVFNIGQR